MPNCSATRAEDSRLRLQTLTISTPSIAWSFGMCMATVFPPAPTTPTRIIFIGLLLLELICCAEIVPPNPVIIEPAEVMRFLNMKTQRRKDLLAFTSSWLRVESVARAQRPAVLASCHDCGGVDRCPRKGSASS